MDPGDAAPAQPSARARAVAGRFAPWREWLRADWFRPAPLQHHLVVLVMTALLPVAGIGAVIVSESAGQAQAHFCDLLRERAGAVVLAFDREIEAVSVALAVMSPSPALRREAGASSFIAGARSVAQALGNDLAVHHEADPGLSPALRQVFADGRPALGIPAPGKPAEPGAADVPGVPVPGVPVYQPVIQGGRVVAVLEMGLTAGQLSSVLAAQNRGEDTLALVLAPGGIVAGGAGPGVPDGGLAVPQWLVSAMAAPEPELARGDWPDGGDRYCALAVPGRAPGWRVAVCAMASSYDESWQVPLRERAVTLAASLVIGIAAATMLARRLVRPLTALTDHARTIASGDDRHVDIPGSPVEEFEALRRSVHDAEVELRRRALAEHLAMLDTRGSQRLLDSVLNGTAEIIHVKDLEGRYVLMNQAARKTLGAGAPEGGYAGLTAFDLLPEESARRASEADRAVIADGGLHAIEVTRTTGSTVRHFALTKTPWRGPNGRIAGVVTVARDVTEARAADASLRALQADLLRATRLSSMGVMASGLAHEINQPLAAARNFLSAAQRLLDRDDPAQARTAVEEAAAETLRAGEIVRRLRGFVARGEAMLKREPIRDVVDGACALARAAEPTAGITILAEYGPGLGEVPLDRIQIQQVLLNLIRNAAEAIRSRGACPADHILLATRRLEDGDVAILVSDTGPGVAKDVLPRMFEPFVSTRPGGLGIGLAICRAIIEGHGGRLSLCPPEKREGACFAIVLPARQLVDQASRGTA